MWSNQATDRILIGNLSSGHMLLTEHGDGPSGHNGLFLYGPDGTTIIASLDATTGTASFENVTITGGSIVAPNIQTMQSADQATPSNPMVYLPKVPPAGYSVNGWFWNEGQNSGYTADAGIIGGNGQLILRAPNSKNETLGASVTVNTGTISNPKSHCQITSDSMGVDPPVGFASSINVSGVLTASGGIANWNSQPFPLASPLTSYGAPFGPVTITALPTNRVTLKGLVNCNSNLANTTQIGTITTPYIPSYTRRIPCQHQDSAGNNGLSYIDFNTDGSVKYYTTSTVAANFLYFDGLTYDLT